MPMKARRSRLYDNLFFFSFSIPSPRALISLCAVPLEVVFFFWQISLILLLFFCLSLPVCVVCVFSFFHLLTFSHPVVDTAEIRSNPLLNVVSSSTLCTARTRITAAKKTLWLSPYQRDTHLRQRRRWYPEEEGGQEEQYYHLLRRQEQQRRP